MGWDEIPTGARRGPLGYIAAFFFFFSASPNDLETIGDDCENSGGGDFVECPVKGSTCGGYMVGKQACVSRNVECAGHGVTRISYSASGINITAFSIRLSRLIIAAYVPRCAAGLFAVGAWE